MHDLLNVLHNCRKWQEYIKISISKKFLLLTVAVDKKLYPLRELLTERPDGILSVELTNNVLQPRRQRLPAEGLIDLPGRDLLDQI